jgi:hypothetical protein
MIPDEASEALLSVARELPQGDDAVWQDRRIIWKQPDTWVPPLTAWLAPSFRADAIRRLKPGVERDLCWDDMEWLDVLSRSIKGSVENLTDSLSDALLPGVVRTYHGCRTDDAGTYFRNGLLVHDRERLKAQVTAIIDAHEELHYMKPQLDRAIAEVDNGHDHGRAYVVVSDKALLDGSAHYLIHGSEWIMSLFDDFGRTILKRIGAPTLIEIDLPLSVTHSSDRRGFAEDMLQEWTRLTCNGQEWIAPTNCSFWLIRDVPPESVVGHSHPASMMDPHNGMRMYRSPVTSCKHCTEDLARIATPALGRV